MRVQVQLNVDHGIRTIEMEVVRMAWDADSHMFYLQDANNNIIFSCPRDVLLFARQIRG